MGNSGSSGNKTYTHQDTTHSNDDAKMPKYDRSQCDSITNCIAKTRINKWLLLYTNTSNQSLSLLNIISNEFKVHYNIIQLLNDFLHLLESHDTNEDFEYIYKQLKQCNIIECNIFRRNYRNRQQSKHITHELDIFDKIHCYFHHSYDIDHRTSHNIDQIKFKQPEAHIYRYKKYNQLSFTKKQNQTQKCYNFGTKFKYEQNRSIYFVDVNRAKHTFIFLSKAKYGNLREELTENKLYQLNKQQFNNEYDKAMDHYNTFYRKKFYSALGKSQILSVMIYTNYDMLQYQFSKTYRENIHQHNEFYHLAKSLKISMTNSRQTTHNLLDQVSLLKDTNSKKALFKQTLYHGIGELLIFPSYMRCQPLSPLSTTISKAVATSFAKEGMLIEFQADYGRPSRLDVSWLSDFANEKELLFIQTGGPGEHLKMKNIIRVHDSYEYKWILEALLILLEIHTINKAKKWVNMQKKMQLLVEALIEHQLHSQFPNKFQPFQSLDAYGKNMVRRFFENQTFLIFDVKYYNKNHLFLRKILFHESYDWINMSVVNALFPNLNEIRLFDCKLCSFMLEDIMKNCQLVHFRNISIFTRSQSELTINDALEQYKDRFVKEYNINVKIQHQCLTESLSLQW